MSLGVPGKSPLTWPSPQHPDLSTGSFLWGKGGTTAEGLVGEFWWLVVGV